MMEAMFYKRTDCAKHETDSAGSSQQIWIVRSFSFV